MNTTEEETVSWFKTWLYQFTLSTHILYSLTKIAAVGFKLIEENSKKSNL